MFEVTTTRHNPLVDPAIHLWGWEIACYLFLGGLVAGMMIISGYFVFSGRSGKHTRCACFTTPLLGLLMLSVGMVFLWLDLEHKALAWRLYTTFQISSPMSWGAWILILVYPAQLATLLLRERNSMKPGWLARISERVRSRSQGARIVGMTNMLLGAILGMYTGILLSALGARPLWNSAILWLLFLVSGLSSAAALVHLVARDRSEREWLARADNSFLAAEIVVIALFLIGLFTSSEVHTEAAALLMSGTFAPVFWVFVVGLGILLPLTVQSLAVNHKVRHTPVAPILVLAGGLVLRFVIVYAGQVSHWQSAAESVIGG